MKHVALALLGRSWLLVLLVAAWELAARRAGDLYFPPPTRIVSAMRELWWSGPASRLWLSDRAVDDFVPSLSHLLLGWALAGIVGIAVGVVIGLSRIAYLVLDPVLQFGRAVPPPTLIPFFMVAFGLGTSMQLAAIVFGVVWPVLLNTADGVRAVEPVQLDSARVFGLGGFARLRYVVLPAAAPRIFAGLRVALGFALILMVIAELMGSGDGIGSRLNAAEREFRPDQLWAGIVLLGALGCVLNGLFLLVERKALAWHRGARRMST
ncbi:ABC transporter permease [Streptomyces aurantiacus]|uniref:Putative aliphatic sulfonates transport permease protein SsuC n=1 Tax=Streptomyces aurantiacus JA 4570 TaxID=1286094 RepID=S3ZDY7_9ACTN|nr:ABC transporter permease [Streptomyces aurantiacus]EPH41891.1 putative aliphatic sulfonates transport permease protein SsuC [Streptomyces aurantiacus JA 4570]